MSLLITRGVIHTVKRVITSSVALEKNRTVMMSARGLKYVGIYHPGRV